MRRRMLLMMYRPWVSILRTKTSTWRPKKWLLKIRLNLNYLSNQLILNKPNNHHRLKSLPMMLTRKKSRKKPRKKRRSHHQQRHSKKKSLHLSRNRLPNLGSLRLRREIRSLLRYLSRREPLLSWMGGSKWAWISVTLPTRRLMPLQMPQMSTSLMELA